MHILDFAEFLIASSSTSKINIANYQHIDSQKPIIVINSTNSSGTLYLRPTVHSRINSYNFDNKGDKPFPAVSMTGSNIPIPFDEQSEGIRDKEIVFTMTDGTKVKRTLRLIYLVNNDTHFAAIFAKHSEENSKKVLEYPNILQPVSSSPTSLYHKISLDYFSSSSYNLTEIKLKNNKNNKEIIPVIANHSEKVFVTNEELEKHLFLETNFATKSMSPANRREYQYALFLEPSWEKNITTPNFWDLEIVINGPSNFTAYDNIYVNNYELKVLNFDNTNIKLLSVSPEKVNLNTHTLNFTCEYLNQNYVIEKPISVTKKKVLFDSSYLKTSVNYTGKMEDFAAKFDKYNFINSKQSEIGGYDVTVTHIDPNLTFDSGDTIIINCRITPPDITDINVYHNTELHTESVLEVRKIEAKVNNNGFLFDSNINVIYPNGASYLLATTTSVTLNFNFYNYLVTYVLQVTVSKKEIALPILNKTNYLYTGLEIIPEFLVNNYYHQTYEKRVNSGKYEIAFKITDPDNYVFVNNQSIWYYNIVPIDVNYDVKDEKVILKDFVGELEYCDINLDKWYDYNTELNLNGKFKFRIKNNPNYNEFVVELRSSKSDDQGETENPKPEDTPDSHSDSKKPDVKEEKESKETDKNLDNEISHKNKKSTINKMIISISAVSIVFVIAATILVTYFIIRRKKSNKNNNN